MGLEYNIPDVLITRADQMLNWGRKNSFWPMPFGTACCAVEFAGAQSPRFDMTRFGTDLQRFAPKQADLLLVLGRISLKMMPVLQRIWEQMPEPKWCISVGACASSGGEFDTYALIQGVDQFIPVHAYVPGCPPRPEAIIDSVMLLQNQVSKESLRDDTRHHSKEHPEIVVS